MHWSPADPQDTTQVHHTHHTAEQHNTTHSTPRATIGRQCLGADLSPCAVLCVLGRRGEVESDGSRALTSGGGGRTRRSLNGPPNPHTGSTDEGSSTSLGLGFCVINYVAAAAMHAVAKHSQAIHRVTVIDIDLHHVRRTTQT